MCWWNRSDHVITPRCFNPAHCFYPLIQCFFPLHSQYPINPLLCLQTGLSGVWQNRMSCCEFHVLHHVRIETLKTTLPRRDVWMKNRQSSVYCTLLSYDLFFSGLYNTFILKDILLGKMEGHRKRRRSRRQWVVWLDLIGAPSHRAINRTTNRVSWRQKTWSVTRGQERLQRPRWQANNIFFILKMFLTEKSAYTFKSYPQAVPNTSFQNPNLNCLACTSFDAFSCKIKNWESIAVDFSFKSNHYSRNIWCDFSQRQRVKGVDILRS